MTDATVTTADVVGCAGRIQNTRWSIRRRRTERPGRAPPTPLVSVVVPTHNRPNLLAEALESVRVQTFADYEIIVMSNGEGTAMQAVSEAIARAHGAQYFRLHGANVSAARNLGVAQAKGEWIAFLDDDDLWLPEKLGRQLDAARATGADMMACRAIRFWPDGREAVSPWRAPPSSTFLQAIHRGQWVATPSAVLVRKNAVIAAGGFDPNQRYCEDTDLWRRIAWRHVIRQMDEPLARHRKHAAGKSEHWTIALYDLRHQFKMRSDTPADLRRTLPPISSILLRWVMRTLDQVARKATIACQERGSIQIAMARSSELRFTGGVFSFFVRRT